ncbi:type II secretion system F family protein [Thermobrachium celere]|uniref:type II secretion system F family protein n=1 Tax=Thermobrachium celere TaxID=53422 RepID=UPI001944EB17|nr:type II secretion system F family protein [Thermobrachium celere]GFR36404.1 general secretion pathway protein GspF [Thermobrachium celere]
MPLFYYKAKTKDGNNIKGVIEADNIEVADTVLRMNSVYPIFIREKSPFVISRRKMSSKDLYLISNQMAMALKSGFDILRAFEFLMENSNDYIKRQFKLIYKRVQEGISLSDAFKETKIFPTFFVCMVRAGEVSGKVDEVMQMLSQYYYKDYKIKNRINQALAYPKLVFIISIMITFVLLNRVVPIFLNVFNQFNSVELPLYTKIVVGISASIKGYFKIYILILLGIIFLIKLLSKNDYICDLIDRLKINIPIIRRIYILNYIVQFSNTLAMLLRSGVSVVSSLEIIEDVIENREIKRNISSSIGMLKSGLSISDSLLAIECFPSMFKNIIKSGEETGRIDDALINVSEFYYNELDEYIKRITVYIEPIILIFIALIIGFIVLSLMLPIFKIYRTII